MTVVLVGNPKPESRTLAAARKVAESITGEESPQVFDLGAFGADILDPASSAMQSALAAVASAEVLVVASPTYKASYTGLLKMFLDAMPGDALAGVTAFPVMLGAGPHHALAPELLLRPVLVELGASCPVRGLYLLDSNYEDPKVLDPWSTRARAALAVGVGR